MGLPESSKRGRNVSLKLQPRARSILYSLRQHVFSSHQHHGVAGRGSVHQSDSRSCCDSPRPHVGTSSLHCLYGQVLNTQIYSFPTLLNIFHLANELLQKRSGASLTRASSPTGPGERAGLPGASHRPAPAAAGDPSTRAASRAPCRTVRAEGRRAQPRQCLCRWVLIRQACTQVGTYTGHVFCGYYGF